MRFSNESYYELLKEKLGRVRHHGHYFSALCPLHDDNQPSLLVYHDGFKCMACQRSGSLAQLFNAVQKKGRKSSKFLSTFPSIEINPKQFSIPPEELAWLAHDALCAFPNQGAYLRQRKVIGQVESAHLGWWNGYFTFPAFDESDSFLSLPTRASSTTEKILGVRWLPCTYALYVPNWPLFLKASHVFIVYGIFDALSLTELGIPACTSTLGKHFNPLWLEKYRTKKFSVIPDRGEEEEAHLLMRSLGWRACRTIQLDYPEGCKDVNDLVVHNCSQYLLSQL